MINKKEVNYTFWFDTETTGLDVQKNFVFQIAYIIKKDSEVLIEKTIECRPDNYDNFVFDDKACKTHGYSNEQITAMQSETEGFKEFISDLKQFDGIQLTNCGFNVIFDIRFINAMFARNNMTADDYYKIFRYKYLDVYWMAWQLRKDGKLPLKSLGLENICDYFNIDHSGAHHAMVDIKNTIKVYEKFLNISSDKI
jgi:DNA polymerase III alpha subunit (gram-positive type)